jgi:hypothetical protein
MPSGGRSPAQPARAALVTVFELARAAGGGIAAGQLEWRRRVCGLGAGAELLMRSCRRVSIISGCSRRRIGSGVALALVAAIGALQPVRVARAEEAAGEWSPEVADVLETYRGGDYVSARALAERILAHSRDPQVRVDAAALRAMTWLQGPSRADRQAGIAEIGQLYHEHPALADRPECNLALGVARSALGETGAALELEGVAAEGFAARGENDRLAAALVALADTWSRHNEWDVTPARFGVPKPNDSAQARQVRRDRIARIRQRVAALPDSTASVARIDVISAQDLLRDDDTAASGVQILEQIAASPEVTPPVATAMITLAGRYETERRWREASELYERLLRAGDPVTAEKAGRKLAAITRPQLRLEAPANVPTGRVVKLEVGARNIAAVQVEVRKLDLRAWLARRQGRLSEALLPVAGSVQLSKRIETQGTQPHDWWESGAAGALELRAPAGAYVVYLHAADESGAPPLKRLLIVSDLAAVAWVGGEQAVIWAGANPQGTSAARLDLSALSADFWMAGSFVPTQAHFAGGIARMELPPEARVLRDHHWVCLVRAGEQLALCCGELPQERRAAGPQVAFTGGPAELRPGELLTIAGVVLNGGSSRQSASAAWQLEIRNVMDEDLATLALEPSAAGMFSVEVPVPESWSGEHLRFVVRRGQQVAENLAPRLMLEVATAGREDFVVCPASAPNWRGDRENVVARIGAWFPWGAPAGLPQLASALRAVRLPDESNGFRPVASDALEIPDPHGQLPVVVRRPGELELPLPLEAFHLPAGPTACGLWATFNDWNGEQTGSLSEILCGAEPVHAWLTSEPAEPTAGQPLELRLGWFDPTGRTGLTAASAVIRRDGEAPKELQFSAQADTSQSARWQPSQPGEYEVEANIPRLDNPPITVRRRLVVKPAVEDTPEKPVSAVRVSAEVTDEQAGAVSVRVEGKLDRPFVVLLATDEPIAAQAFARLDGTGECSFVAPPNACGLQAQVVSLAPSGPVTLAAAEVAAPRGRELQIDVKTDQALLPGQRVALPLKLRTVAGECPSASLLALLRPALRSGPIEWVPGQSAAETVTADAPPATAPGPRPAASWSCKAAESGTAVPSSSAPDVPPVLLSGGTLWAACQPAADKTLELALPQTPGVYRLSVLARDERGTRAEKDILLDTRGGLRLYLDAPDRCSLGDRFVIGLALQNAHAAPVAADVTVDPGAGLSIESLRIVDPPEAAQAEAAAPLAREIVVPANGVAWLQARVEAVQAGCWNLKMSARFRSAQAGEQARGEGGAASAPMQAESNRAQEASVNYSVIAERAASTGDRPLLIKRTVLLLEKDTTRVDPQAEGLGQPEMQPSRWQRYVLPADARLEPGQRVVVRESFTLPQSAAALRWSQRIPPNCSFAAMPVAKPQAVGTPERRRADELDFRNRGMPAGPHEHEYELVATRPGVCVLPLPEIWISGQRMEIAADPGERRLNVIGAPEPW